MWSHDFIQPMSDKVGSSWRSVSLLNFFFGDWWLAVGVKVNHALTIVEVIKVSIIDQGIFWCWEDSNLKKMPRQNRRGGSRQINSIGENVCSECFSRSKHKPGCSVKRNRFYILLIMLKLQNHPLCPPPWWHPPQCPPPWWHPPRRHLLLCHLLPSCFIPLKTTSCLMKMKPKKCRIVTSWVKWISNGIDWRKLFQSLEIIGQFIARRWMWELGQVGFITHRTLSCEVCAPLAVTWVRVKGSLPFHRPKYIPYARILFFRRSWTELKWSVFVDQTIRKWMAGHQGIGWRSVFQSSALLKPTATCTWIVLWHMSKETIERSWQFTLTILSVIALPCGSTLALASRYLRTFFTVRTISLVNAMPTPTSEGPFNSMIYLS